MDQTYSTYVIVFELLIVLFFAIFARIDTNSDVTYESNFASILVFIVGIMQDNIGFTLLGSIRKSLSWTSLGNLLLILGVIFQWFLLWGTFFNSCFNQFYGAFSINSSLVIQAAFCTLCILLIGLDLIGKFYYSQILIISLIQTLGYSLNAAVINYGLKTFDAGGGMQVFLYSAVSTLTIAVISFQMMSIDLKQNRYTYPSFTIGFIGMLFIIYGWPSFNSGGALLSNTKTITDLTTSLQSSALVNTVLALAASIVCSLVFANNQKLKPNVFFDCILSGGIIVASAVDIIIDPVASIILGGTASVVTIMVHKYLSDNFFMVHFPQACLRLIFGFLASIFASILVAGRQNRSPSLVGNPSDIGGKEVAAGIITILISVTFGAICGFVLKMTQSPPSLNFDIDSINWQFRQEMMPIYPHDPQHKEMVENTPRIQTQLISKVNKYEEPVIFNNREKLNVAIKQTTSQMPPASSARRQEQIFYRPPTHLEQDHLPKESIINVKNRFQQAAFDQNISHELTASKPL